MTDKSSALPPQEARIQKLILHAKQLLEWVPTCSPGSSGFVRQENLRNSIALAESAPLDALTERIYSWLGTKFGGGLVHHVLEGKEELRKQLAGAERGLPVEETKG